MNGWDVKLRGGSGGGPPRVFWRKDVILWELCVGDVQECDSKGVIGLEWWLRGDGGV